MTPPGASIPEAPAAPRSGESAIRFVVPISIFLLVFLQLRLRVDTSLRYLKGPGLFVLDLGFLRQFLDYPGRPGRYVTLFIEESYWFPTQGALVASGIVTCSSLLAYGLFRRTSPTTSTAASGEHARP